MEKFNELLEKLNGLSIIQKSIDWEECLPQEVYDEYFGSYFPLKSGLDIDTHRWYETSVSVIKIYDKILGIRHITNLFSEASSCSDIHFTIKFFEMKEVSVISYETL